MEALTAAAVHALQDPNRGRVVGQARAYARRELAWDRLTAPLGGIYEAVRVARESAG